MENFILSINEFKENESTESPIWIFFEKIPNRKEEAICLICNREIKCKYSSTTGMIKHLKVCHGSLSKFNAAKIFSELSELKEERQKRTKRKLTDGEALPVKKQKTLEETVKNTAPYGPQHPRKVELDNALISMLAMDCTPNNAVLRPGFAHFTKVMDPRYTLPHPSTIKRSLMPKMKNVVGKHLTKKTSHIVREERSVAFSCDGLDAHDVERSSVYDFSIYCLQGKELVCETLFVKKIETPVNAIAVKSFLKECLLSAGFLNADHTPKLAIWAVTDKGSNIIAALKQLKAEEILAGYANCFNHKLQLVIKDALQATPGMEKSIDLFTKNATLYSRSKTERKDYRNECKKSGVTPVQPPVPGDTRWFGKKFMSDAYLKRKREFTIHNATSDRLHQVTQTDWKNLQGFSEVMEPCQIATKIEEGDSYLTLPTAIPVLHILRQKISAYITNPANSGYGITFARNIVSALEDRFGSQFLKMRPHCFSTFCDPRYKHIYESRKPEVVEARAAVLEWVKLEMEELEIGNNNTSSSSSNASNGDSSFWGEFDASSKKVSPQRLSVESELQKWQEQSSVPRSHNPLEVMESLKADFPRIYAVYRKYCVIPSTQNRDERIFSMVARITTPQCRSITVESIENKILIGSAIRQNGFIFNYKDADEMDSSSELEEE